jgi:hypothetical protein
LVFLLELDFCCCFYKNNKYHSRAFSSPFLLETLLDLRTFRGLMRSARMRFGGKRRYGGKRRQAARILQASGYGVLGIAFVHGFAEDCIARAQRAQCWPRTSLTSAW